MVLIADGVRYEVPATDWQRDMPAIIDYYQSKVRNLGEHLEKLLSQTKDPKLQERLLDRAIAASQATEAEVRNWSETRDGQIFITWFQMLKVPAQRHITAEQAAEILGKALMAQARKEGAGRTSNSAPVLSEEQMLARLTAAGITPDQIAAIERECHARAGKLTDADRMDILLRHGVKPETLLTAAGVTT
jgi:hypothetical protein